MRSSQSRSSSVRLARITRGFVGGLFAFNSGCFADTGEPDGTGENQERVATGGSFSIPGVAGGSGDGDGDGDIFLGGSGGSGGGGPLCEVPGSALNLFTEQRVDAGTLGTRVLYTWVTAQEEEQLRSEGSLLESGETSAGPSPALERLEDWLSSADEASEPDRAVARTLAQTLAQHRSAWSNPWANRISDEEYQERDRLVQIELREDAWIAQLSHGNAGVGTVIDLDGAEIPREQVEAAPENIAVLYYQQTASGKDPFMSCFAEDLEDQVDTVAYREYVVGNPDMIASWSLGTEELQQRLQRDIDLLTEYLRAVRACAPIDSERFAMEASCFWGDHIDSYMASLAFSNDHYVPQTRTLVQLIETLQEDLFEPDPYEHRLDPSAEEMDDDEEM